MARIVLAFAGKAGSGKDTACDYLVNKHGFTKIAFALPLKAGMAAMGFPEPADRALKELPIDGFNFSWREAAQTLGTEWGRSLDKDLWLKLCMRFIKSNDLNICISDARFDNELDSVRGMSGHVVHLSGRQADLGSRAAHASENEMMMCNEDYFIDNSGPMHELEESLFHMVTTLRAVK